MEQFQKLKQQLQETVRQRMDMSSELSDAQIGEIIDSVIMEKSREVYMSAVTKLTLRQELFNAIRRLDLLQELIDDKTVTEIMVNGADAIFYERDGRISTWDRHFESREKLEDVIQQIVSRSNRQVNESIPIVDARLKDGSRVNVVLDPVALNGPILTIRKFPEPVTMDKLIRLGSISREAAVFLRTAVRAGYNIFVSGGTGSGKTTFLNALSEFIPEDERVITIEDSAELQIRHVPNLVRLETRVENRDGSREISMRDLIRASLRMRPDRILVGEVRGAEALEMLQAMNTGHDGSISTGHGNSPRDMVTRLETMVLMAADLPLAAVRNQIASALELMVHLGRMRDKSRKVLEIAEVIGCENGEVRLEPLFTFREKQARDRQWVEGSLEKVGELRNREKLRAGGFES